MTAQAVERRGLLTAAEAAKVLGFSKAYVLRLAARGAIAGSKVSEQWLLESSSVRAYAARPAPVRLPLRVNPPRGRVLPAGPFLSLLDGRGGALVCGVTPGSAEERAIERARRSGWLTEEMADRLAVRLLRLTPWEVWGL